MRVLLIRPAQIRWIDEARRVGTPTGLLSIAAMLLRHHDVEIIDAVAQGYDNEVEVKPGIIRFGVGEAEILRRIDIFKPDVVGITNLFTLYWGTTWRLVTRIKAHAPDVLTILGGHHASEAAEEILALDHDRNIDFIVMKEGEETIVELLSALETRGDPADVAGLAYRDRHGRVCVTAARPLIAHIDQVPDPAWGLLKCALYRREMSHHGPPRGDNFIDVSFSRGCPVGCYFCTSTTYWGKRFRVFSEERVRRQLATIWSLGWEEIVVEDDNFSALPFETQRQICTALKETGLPWCNDGGLYLPLLDEKKVALLADTGCYRVFLPVETPSVEVIQAQHKYRGFQSNEHFLVTVRKATGLLRAAGIEFYSSLMVGFPSDTIESLRRSCEFADYLIQECGAFGVAFHWVHDYPGTRNYHGTAGLPAWHTAPETYTFTRADPAFRQYVHAARTMRNRFPQPSRDVRSGAVVRAPQHDFRIPFT